MTDPTRIHWSRKSDGVAVGSPDTARWESLSFPPAWPDRPWVFGVMVASANGVVAWRRRGPGDDPVQAILGGDDRPERIADRRLMRYVRTIGDVGIGAQTVREQPRLVLTPQEPGDEPAPDLYAFRVARGLSYHPRNVVYSLCGRLPLGHPIFNTPGLEAIVVTTPAGEARLRGHDPPPLPLIVEHGIRYLACEGGQTLLNALHEAGLVDEVFLTVTDVVIDKEAHDGIVTRFDFQAERAELVAEGKISRDSGYWFQRWRFRKPGGAASPRRDS